MNAIIYKNRDLKAVRGYFRGDKRFGRTTKLVHVPTGRELFEVMGECPKGKLIIQFHDHLTKLNGELHAANPNS